MKLLTENNSDHLNILWFVLKKPFFYFYYRGGTAWNTACTRESSVVKNLLWLVTKSSIIRVRGSVVQESTCFGIPIHTFLQAFSSFFKNFLPHYWIMLIIYANLCNFEKSIDGLVMSWQDKGQINIAFWIALSAFTQF